MPGVISAPPRKSVFLVWANYGSITGARSVPRGRLWILTDDPNDLDSTMWLRIAWNHPVSGQVEYEDLGEIAIARVRNGGKLAEVQTVDGTRLSMVVAPCVCGAGAVGNAPPDEGRISLQYVNPYGRARLQVL
jgi:hypothetical protein